jgi:aminopeptidase N
MTRRPAAARAAIRAAALAAATAAAFTIAHAQPQAAVAAPGASTAPAASTAAAAPTAAKSAPERFHFDRTPGRLPKDARPLTYRLAFDLDPAQDGFAGTAAITVELRRPMPALLLHAARLEAGDASVQGRDGRRRALRVEPDTATSTWRLVPADGAPLAPGRHTLHLAWRGQVQRSGEGLYRVEATSTGGAGPMLFTQLQAVYARTLFPSFDEPAFRAVFEIAVRAPRGLQVESNMPRQARVDEGGAAGTVTLHRFAATPSMPSYLVALAVGRFDTLEGRAGAVPLRIFTAPGKRAQAGYAMGATQQLLPYFGRYFGLPYALPKLDQLAVPGVRNGAMEDWGLISYNEALLLVDRERSGPDTQRWVFALAAHEIAHQWFGNLVTAASWDEIWLNEAFATWMENKATDQFNPDWQLPLEVRRHLDRTMARDASTATRAIRGGLVDESRVSSQFDNITYNKGGAVLSMLEQWLGPEVFRRGLASYMRERRYSNAAAGDLWHHLARASGRDVAAVAASWTDQPGVPVVSLTQDCRGGRTLVRLAQRRFAVEPGLTPQRWRIPVQLRQGGRQSTLLLDAAEAEHPLGPCSRAPVLANAGGRGYYRVKYAADAQPALAAALPGLDPADRMTLLSDSFALAQAGEQTLSGYLALLKHLPAAEGPGRAALFAQAGDALGFLDDAFAGLPAQAHVHDAARALFGPELKRLGWAPQAGEPATAASLRARLIGLLARFDDAEAIAEARARFEADASGRAPLPPALRPGIVAAVGRHATDGEFAHLRQQLLAAGSEEDRWLLASALAASGSPAQVEAVLALSLSGQLPPNIACELPGLVARAGRFGSRAYDFTKQNFEALAKLAGIGPFGGSRWLLPNAAQAFHDTAHAAALMEDQQRLAGDAGAAEAGRVAARIRLHAAVREREAGHFIAAR